MKHYKVRRSVETDADLASIAAFLYRSYRSFGDDDNTSRDRAKTRVRRALAMMTALADNPERHAQRRIEGTSRTVEVRLFTENRMMVYYRIDEERREVRVLGIFFGGQDHEAMMVERLMA